MTIISRQMNLQKTTSAKHCNMHRYVALWTQELGSEAALLTWSDRNCSSSMTLKFETNWPRPALLSHSATLDIIYVDFAVQCAEVKKI